MTLTKETIILTEKKIWLPLTTTANCELKLKEKLDYLKLEHFIPTRKKIIRHARTVKEVDRPLIPSLIFIHTTWKEAHHLRSLYPRKIFLIYQYDRTVLSIPDQEMERFIQFITINQEEEIHITHEPIVGDKVMIKTGPLAGTQGLLAKCEGKNYFTIRLKGLCNASIRILKKDLKVVR